MLTFPSIRPGHRSAPDIDATNELLLSDADEDAKRAAFLDWTARHQPCVFGRIATKSGTPARGLAMNLCWITNRRSRPDRTWSPPASPRCAGSR